MTSNLTRTLLILFSISVLWSCSDDDDGSGSLPSGENGFFILNEGAYGGTNASLSFYDRETSTITNDVFYTANNYALGDQAQSMTLYDSLLFIVVQNSGKIEVVNKNTYQSIATITDSVSSPRYLTIISDSKAYISDWGSDGVSGKILVLDLSTFSVTHTFDAGAGPNQIVKYGNQAFVALSGGWSSDDEVIVVNTNTDQIDSRIETGDNPSELFVDENGKLWVAGVGALSYNQDYSIDEDNSTYGFLARYTLSGSKELYIDMPDITSYSISDLTYLSDDELIYFSYNGSTYQFSTSSTSFPTSTFISEDFYGLGYDSYTGYLVTLQAPDFSSSGNMIFYDNEGTKIKTFTVGIGPNSIVLD